MRKQTQIQTQMQTLARIIESKMAWSRRLVEGARSTLGVGAGHTGGA